MEKEHHGCHLFINIPLMVLNFTTNRTMTILSKAHAIPPPTAPPISAPEEPPLETVR